MTTSEITARPWVPDRPGISSLRSSAHQCRGCELWVDATQVVFSTGARTSPIVLVGEQPGDVEDREGEPFVGPAGGVLDAALEAAGIDRHDVYLTNAVKHFRHEIRGKRRIHHTPGARHIVACHPWLEAELTVVKPDVVVCLGSVAARSVTGRPVKITEERGVVLDAREEGVSHCDRVIITSHPSAILRLRALDDPRPAREAMADLVADLRLAAGNIAAG